MAIKHTPGPWRFEATTKTIRSVPTNYWIATMDSWDGAVASEANARVIAKAPELIAALDRLARAARNLDNTQGDPIRLLDVKAELRAAEAEAAKVLWETRGDENA